MLQRYKLQARHPEIGESGQESICKSRVVIVGVGGLGCISAMQLARAGVGHILLIDDDEVEKKNLHRQMLYDEADVHSPKAEVAAKKLRKVNSDIEVRYLIERYQPNSLLPIGSSTVIIDGTDNFSTRYLINDYCIKVKIPWIYGGCVGTNGMAQVIIPHKTACFRCVHGEPPENPTTGREVGILSPVASMVASFQAMEALKICAGRSDAVVKDLVTFDAWKGNMTRIETGRREDCPTCGNPE